MDTKQRCSWCLKDTLYMDYHDNIWGIPEYDDRKLFEFLNLEGAQAGLSWYSILKRFDGYRNAFSDWDVEIIAGFSKKKKESLMQDPGIIRNRLKIEAVQINAKAYLNIMESHSFSDYLWNFVGGQPIINQWEKLSDIPASTDLSEKISKDLKSKGFKFVGPTIVYAFMQAVGMVDDHITSCWKRG
ncbi:MAG: DNA-3-methyladenine glycosylase I [Bacteroidia bacterium]|nr:DNA-3-methyladenine glycosylase I [Bacteroidia bacterium]